MRTLDEVIAMAEHCWQPMPESLCATCPSENKTSKCRLYSDMLYYLKEYHEHLKWQAYEEHCLAEEKKKIKQAYEQGYAKAKEDEEVNRRWDESYRASQMPWNHYTEMGG